MRNFVKTVAVLALALALLSTSAFAAIEGTVAKDGTYTASLSGLTADEQITLIAVDKVSEGAIASDANILYIDQKAAAGTTDSFEGFSVLNDGPGKTVYFFAGSESSDTAVYLGAVTEEEVNAFDIVGEKTVDPVLVTEGTDNEHGVGVAITITNPATFTEMIWVFVTGPNNETDRFYSAPVECSVAAVTGDVTLAAAFKNGTKASAGKTVIDVDAIFKTADGKEYYTNKTADLGNKNN